MIMPVPQKERERACQNFLDAYVCDVTALRRDTQLYARAFEVLPNFRQKKAQDFVFPKDRALSAGAWLLLQYAMKQRELPDFEKRIAYTKYEKPYIKDGNIHFNLSHSSSFVMCALSSEPVGCDIQSIEDLDEGLLGYCMNAKEQEIIEEIYAKKQLRMELLAHEKEQAKPVKSASHAKEQLKAESLSNDKNVDASDAKAWAFYRLWTLKEALMKIEGSGLNIAPKEICFTEVDSQHCYYSYSCQRVKKEDYSFKEFFDIEGYCASLCSCLDISACALNNVPLDLLLEEKAC